MTKDMQDHVDATDDSGSRESPGDDGGGGGGEGMDNPAFTPDSNTPSPDDSQTSGDIKLEIEPEKEDKTDVVEKKDQTNGLPLITFKANGKKQNGSSMFEESGIIIMAKQDSVELHMTQESGEWRLECHNSAVFCNDNILFTFL